MSFDLLIDQLKQVFKSDLPGFDAHQLLAPKNRLTSNSDYINQNPDHKIACVLALIYLDEINLNLILIERTDKGNHAGQIALPGGKMESGETHTETALRETFEEIGVAVHASDVIGKLSEVYIPPSNFLVHPFVAVISARPVFILEAREVKRIIEIPLPAFFKPDVIKERTFSNSKFVDVTAPYYEVNGVEIWGATAMIISELIYLLKNIYQPENSIFKQ